MSKLNPNWRNESITPKQCLYIHKATSKSLNTIYAMKKGEAYDYIHELKIQAREYNIKRNEDIEQHKITLHKRYLDSIVNLLVDKKAFNAAIIRQWNKENDTRYRLYDFLNILNIGYYSERGGWSEINNRLAEYGLFFSKRSNSYIVSRLSEHMTRVGTTDTGGGSQSMTV